jgi:O-antigen/teichoic acid export membrane protein
VAVVMARAPLGIQKGTARLFFKAVSSALEKACRLLLVFVAAPVLGAASFGVFQYASTVVNLLTLCTEFGLGTWTTRALAREPERAGSIEAAGLRLRTAAIVPYVLLLGSFALAQAQGNPRNICILLGVAALAGSFVDYIAAILRGYQDFRREAAASTLRGALTLAGGLGALHLLRSLLGFAAGVAVGATASAGLALLMLHRKGRIALRDTGDRSAFDRKTARLAISETIPLWLAGILSTLYFKCDIIIVRYFCSDSEVGAYGAAYRMFEASTLLPSTIMAVAFPRLAADHGMGRARQLRWTRLERRLVTLLVSLGGLAGIAMYVASDQATNWVFGSDFARSAHSLRVLALDVPVLFLNFALAPFLIARGKERSYLVLAALLLILNVGVNLVSIRRLGGPGAAWATLVTDVVRSIGCLAVLGVGRNTRPAPS